MTYIRRNQELGLPPGLIIGGIKTAGSLIKVIGGLFGGGTTKATVSRWRSSMPGWAQQVVSVDDLYAAEKQSNGGGTVVGLSKDIDASAWMKRTPTQAELTEIDWNINHHISEAQRVPNESNWHTLSAALFQAGKNVALYGNPLGQPQSPSTPAVPGLPVVRGGTTAPATSPGTTPGPSMPAAQTAGFPMWAMILIGAGIGLPVIIGILKSKGK